MSETGIMILNSSILEDMALILSQALFSGIPLPPIMFDDDIEEIIDSGDKKLELGEDEGALGQFIIKQGESYEEKTDKYKDEPGKERYKKLGFGIYEKISCIKDSWAEPINNPYIRIEISSRFKIIANNIQLYVFLATFIHELVHYYCWYMGYDWRDGTGDFETLCKNLDIPTNYPPYTTWKNGEYVTNYDYRKMERFVTVITQARKRVAAGLPILGLCRWKNTP